MNFKSSKKEIIILAFLVTLGLCSFSALAQTETNIMNDNTVLSDYAQDVLQGEQSIANDPEAQNNQSYVNENEIVSGREEGTILDVQNEIDQEEFTIQNGEAADGANNDSQLDSNDNQLDSNDSQLDSNDNQLDSDDSQLDSNDDQSVSRDDISSDNGENG